jgi:hypothetical protein
MEGTWFDSWTRRRFGLAAGSAAAAGLFGLLGASETEARKNNNNNDRNNKKRCRKLGQSCNENKKNQDCCSAKQLCANVSGLGTGNFCCKQVDQGCLEDTDCCGRNFCDSSGHCRTS